MTDNNAVEFVTELPARGRSAGRKRDPRWAVLEEHPGEWAIYWGAHTKTGIVTTVQRMRPESRDGHFETKMRAGTNYVRFVPAESS